MIIDHSTTIIVDIYNYGKKNGPVCYLCVCTYVKSLCKKDKIVELNISFPFSELRHCAGKIFANEM